MAPAPRSGCAINAAVEVLGDPWAILVLRDIMFGNRRHFRELVAGSEEGIATNILAGRLKQLVAAGLLSHEATRRGRESNNIRCTMARSSTCWTPIGVLTGAGVRR